MNTPIKIIMIAVIIVVVIVSLTVVYFKNRNYETVITDADTDTINRVIREKLGDEIFSDTVNGEGKEIKGRGTLYFLKTEIKEGKVNEVTRIISKKAKDDGIKETDGNFGIEYVDEINKGDVKSHHMCLGGGDHGKTLVEEMWIVEIDGKTYLYYCG